MKKVFIIILVLFSGLLILSGCKKEITGKNKSVNFNKVIEKQYNDSKIKIVLFESENKIFDKIPELIKLKIENTGDKKFSYTVALIDSTNNTGGCPGDCTTTLFSDSGKISKKNFEKTFNFNSPSMQSVIKDLIISSKNYKNNYYNYDLNISILNKFKGDIEYWYTIENSYGYMGNSQEPTKYTISGGKW